MREEYWVYGEVIDNQLQIRPRRALFEIIAQLNGKEVELMLRVKQKGFSDPQRRLYWHYLRLIGKELGYDAETLHDTFRAKFLVDRRGDIPVVRSTTSLTVNEFQEYLEGIKQLAAEMGIVLDEPL